MNKSENLLNRMQKEQHELQETINQMDKIREEIARLDKLGVELTARANMQAGRLEVLKELIDEDMEDTTPRVVDEMTPQQLIEAVERGISA